MKLSWRVLRLLIRMWLFWLGAVTLLAFYVYRIRLHIAVQAIYLNKYPRDDNTYNDHAIDYILKYAVPRKFVVMSVSMVNKQNFFYAMYLPVSALAWRRMGYEPLVFIVKDKNDPLNELTSKPIEYLNMFNVRVIHVDTRPQYVRHVGMLSRLFVGILPDEVAHDQDFIMTSDTDFLPIRKSYFTFFNTNAITLLDAREARFEHKGKPYEMPEVFIPYIGMRKWQWREVMRLRKGMPINGSTIIDKVNEIHGPGSVIVNTNFVRGDQHWYLDQRTVTIAINEYVKSGKRRTKINRYPYAGVRLDRGWPEMWNATLHWFHYITDSHLYHSDSLQMLEYTLALLRKIFSPAIIKVLEKYFDEFKAVMSKTKE
jgi:hypothetical protein